MFSKLKFKNAQVRDLAWVLLGPNLLMDRERLLTQSESVSWATNYADHLDRLDLDPLPLEKDLASRLNSPRLGRYFEALLAFWFSEVVKPEIFLASLPIRSGGLTLGEFESDFLNGRESRLPIIGKRRLSFILIWMGYPLASHFFGYGNARSLRLKDEQSF